MSYNDESLSKIAINAATLCFEAIKSLKSLSVISEEDKLDGYVIAFSNFYINVGGTQNETSNTLGCKANEGYVVYIDECFASSKESQNISIVKLAENLDRIMPVEAERNKVKTSRANLVAVYNDIAVLARFNFLSREIDYDEIDKTFIHLDITVPATDDISKELSMVSKCITQYIRSVR